MSDIFIVDDHAVMREGLRILLQKAGHQVVGEAYEPVSAIQDLVRLVPELVLLDVKLDYQSGFEVLEEVQRRKLPSRVIMITMSQQPRHVAEAMRLGAFGYVLKESSGDEMLRAVEAVSHGRRYLCSRAAAMALQGLSSRPALADALSAREKQVILMVVRGMTSAAIGKELELSPKTVESYRSRIMAKLDVDDVPALVRLAIREGLISAEER
ncbi:response regulator transcription factor [Hydrogenophaga sp.]|uniref:response regulator n=1 Tax=Hydrogenophaga sp. TaxID=1904254 RepID=UPI002715841D|nr:response regulator transcription factor [Hydrogenophaga sp.]MDO9435675.1 response regulator transcription factor [Hydrogenophaga sp.]